MNFDFGAPQKMDMRIRRTHKLLTDALFSLLETTQYDDISVVTICEKAMVHRATFYNHFKDKDEFIAYVARTKIQELFTISIKNADSSDLKSLYKSVINTTLTYIDDNRRMLTFAARNSSSALVAQIHDSMLTGMIKFIELSKSYGENYKAPADVTASFISGGFITLIFWWLDKKPDYTKDEMQLHLERLLLISDIDDDEKIQ